MSTTYVFPIAISCINCVNTVHSCLNTAGGCISWGDSTITISNFNASFVDKTLTITVEEEGLDPAVVVELLNSKLDDVGLPCRESPPVINFIPGLSGVLSGMTLLLLPLIVGPLSTVAMGISGMASVALTLVLGRDSFKKALKLLVNERKLHMDTLFSVSTLTAMSVSIAALFTPGLPMMFEAGLLIFGFRHIGEAIKESLVQSMGLRARFQDLAPKTVKKLNGTEVPTDDLLPGDIILVEPGGVVPVDGVCIHGDGLLKTAIVNGGLEPEPIHSGMGLSAGMTLIEGSIHLKVTAPASESLLARKDKSIAASIAAKESASWETTADSVMHYFIPAVFVLAIISGAVCGYFFSTALAIQCAVTVLVSACPCTLGLVTGLAVKVGMKKAFDHDVVFKSARKLEEMDKISHVVFDLNGTLTTRMPEIISCHINYELTTEEKFFKHLAMLEAHSSKAIAQVICKYYEDRWEKAPKTDDIDASNFSGLQTMIDGERYLCGNSKMMMDNGINPVSLTLESDQSVVYLARDNMILGHIILSRPLRKEAADVVRALKNMGKQVHICTGADKDTAMRYAKTLNIPEANVRHTLLSFAKVDYINALKAIGGGVAMIGDELNDADAIKASDFGMAMPADGGGINLTRKLANAVSNVDSLESIIAAFEIAQQTVMNIKQNLKFNLAYNIAAMLLPAGLLFTTGIALNPGVGVALMFMQTGLILLNTYWFKEQELVWLKQARRAVVEKGSYSCIKSLMPALEHQASPNKPSSCPAPRSACEPKEGSQDVLSVHGNTNIPDIFDSPRFANANR